MSGPCLAQCLARISMFCSSRSEAEPSPLCMPDPDGFTIVDVFAWGSIGHALGYFALATSSLQANHVPTF